MFVGIIQEVGKVKEKFIDNNNININVKANEIIANLDVGNEININGLNFVINEIGESYFKAKGKLKNIINNNIDNLEKSAWVNLEKEVQPYKYQGSHVISGNINDIGEIIEIKKLNGKRKLRLKTTKDLNDYFSENNSIAINGISLTIQKLINKEVVVNILNTIWENTNLKHFKIGDKVNIETDIVGRYIGEIIEKQKEIRNKKEMIKEDLLKDNGFI